MRRTFVDLVLFFIPNGPGFNFLARGSAIEAVVTSKLMMSPDLPFLSFL